jgi:hypothetical protein
MFTLVSKKVRSNYNLSWTEILDEIYFCGNGDQKEMSPQALIGSREEIFLSRG